MTLNSVIDRIKSICEAHGQIHSFGSNQLLTEFLTGKTQDYATAFLQFTGGNISMAGQATTISFRLFFLDLVNRSEDTLGNEIDVQSDMLSIAQDILAKMNYGDYTDWRISDSNSLTLVAQKFNDFLAGCYVDFNVRIKFTQNVCQVP